MKIIQLIIIVFFYSCNTKPNNVVYKIDKKTNKVELWSKELYPKPITDTSINMFGDTLIYHHYSNCYDVVDGKLILNGKCN